MSGRRNTLAMCFVLGAFVVTTAGCGLKTSPLPQHPERIVPFPAKYNGVTSGT